MTRAARPNHLAISKMVAAMIDEPKSIEELADVSGLCVQTVRHYVLTLRKEKAVYIAEWHADRRSHISVAAYRVGNRKDAERPAAKPSAAGERWKAWERRRQQIETMRLMVPNHVEQPHQ